MRRLTSRRCNLSDKLEFVGPDQKGLQSRKLNHRLKSVLPIMSFWEFLQQNWHELLTLLRQHFLLVLISTLIAVVIGIPTGILLTRKKALRSPVLGIANIMQTIPSLALFGFLIPLPFIGGIGARTAIVALVVYALLPIIRNTVTGILGVDQNVREAAVAMGMTNGQILWQVELPLAMSVILTGVRVATVISVGVTTIAAAVGAGGLGVYIFRGLRQYDNNLLLAGAVPAALMALAADFSLGLLEKHFSVEARSRKQKTNPTFAKSGWSRRPSSSRLRWAAFGMLRRAHAKSCRRSRRLIVLKGFHRINPAGRDRGANARSARRASRATV